MFKLNFLSQKLPAFGLDVSGSSFKFIQFQQKGKEIEVKNYHDAPLPKGLIINDLITDVKTFDYLLKTAMEKPQFGRLDGNFAVASLPESKSFVRVIQIPKMSETEADSAVPYEAENFIPLPIDQVYLDWQTLGDSGDKMNILIIASPKEFVEKYLDILDKAGVKTVGLEVESQSCHRALVSGGTETLLLVDLGAFRTSLMMVEDGNLQFTSNIAVSGNSFTESIARSLGVSSAKAEDVKKKVGISNTAEYPNVKTALLPVLNNLSEVIKNILKFHSEHSGKQVTKVLLMGGSSKLMNLPEFLAPQLASAGVTSVALANPWENLKTLKSQPLNALDSLGFVTAIGLAERGMNYEIS